MDFVSYPASEIHSPLTSIPRAWNDVRCEVWDPLRSGALARLGGGHDWNSGPLHHLACIFLLHELLNTFVCGRDRRLCHVRVFANCTRTWRSKPSGSRGGPYVGKRTTSCFKRRGRSPTMQRLLIGLFAAVLFTLNAGNVLGLITQSTSIPDVFGHCLSVRDFYILLPLGVSRLSTAALLPLGSDLP